MPNRFPPNRSPNIPGQPPFKQVHKAANRCLSQKTGNLLSSGNVCFSLHKLSWRRVNRRQVLAVADAKGASKTWGVIAKEKSVDMGQISKDSRQLEDSLKKLKRSN
jgi:hypothetical protein